MAEPDDLKLQDTNNGSTPVEAESLAVTRRDFFNRALAATGAGVAISGILDSTATVAAAQAPPACPAIPAFANVGQITSQAKKLQVVLKIKNKNRKIEVSTELSSKFGTEAMLRYFEGYNAANGTQLWPPSGNNAPFPGPTLVARVGDTVEITFLNQVKVEDFGGALDSNPGCDAVTRIGVNGVVNNNWYPGTDVFPNCLHGSSTANLHFHGTHVTPDRLGDNVLLSIRPNPKITEKEVSAAFRKIFDAYAAGKRVRTWADLPPEWIAAQKTLLAEYDKIASFRGSHGLDLHWLPQDESANSQGVWPQYYIGSYPYCFTLPEYPGNNPEHDTTGIPLRMGQAPGTHWYHARKHGSATINMFNALEGAFIIRGEYDAKLQQFYNGKLKEQVIMIHQVTPTPNLLNAFGSGGPAGYVNGLINPTITMAPGQVQLWRIINGSVQRFFPVEFAPVTAGKPNIQFKQVAQDGVQFNFHNYGVWWDWINKYWKSAQARTMSPGNRMDILVQAPNVTGCYTFGGGILNVNVTGSPTPMPFPMQQGQFSPFPPFLADVDITKVQHRREINYGWNKGAAGPGRAPDGSAPKYTINGKQFDDQVVAESMLLDSAEEWTIYNSTSVIFHPFHIHVNPFQVIEIFDPATMTTPLKIPPPWIWWDTFGLPPAANGKNGYIKMLTRFVDFPGSFVDHCHIMAHADRGMMQLIQVVPNPTVSKDH